LVRSIETTLYISCAGAILAQPIMVNPTNTKQAICAARITQ
jgi:transcriptional regulator with XRE-family HTH domain